MSAKLLNSAQQCQDQKVTMPMHDEDIPRLAEIVRSLTDFRHEFRTFTGEVVRKDVYSAHMTQIQMQIDILNKEHARMTEQREADRRQVRNAFMTAAGSIVVMVITLITQMMIK